MQSQSVLRILVGVIVVLVAAMLFGSIANLGGALIALSGKALLVLLLVALIIRFLTIVDQKRKPF